MAAPPIEGIDVRRPAVHEQVHDAVGLGGEVRPARGEGIGAAGRGLRFALE
jgi:hypothetical protein